MINLILQKKKKRKINEEKIKKRRRRKKRISFDKNEDKKINHIKPPLSSSFFFFFYHLSKYRYAKAQMPDSNMTISFLTQIFYFFAQKKQKNISQRYRHTYTQTCVTCALRFTFYEHLRPWQPHSIFYRYIVLFFLYRTKKKYRRCK